MPGHDMKFCSACRTPKTIDKFALTTARGKVVRRSWCRVCLKAYYAYRNRKRGRDREVRRADK